MWGLAGIGWPRLGWCFSVLRGLSSSRRPVWACSQGGCGTPREHVKPKSILRSRLGSRLSLHHHHHLLLAKAARVLEWRYRLLNERSSKVILSRHGYREGGKIGTLFYKINLTRSPTLGEGDGNPLQYSCMENPLDREAWRASVHGGAESDMPE